jgi:hypothetical protein
MLEREVEEERTDGEMAATTMSIVSRAEPIAGTCHAPQPGVAVDP